MSEKTKTPGVDCERRYFLTVDWCNKGPRGIFCNRDGKPCSQEAEHTQEEMAEILGVFWMVLSPQSLSFTKTELKKFNRFRPLAEYSGEFGIAFHDQREGDLCRK